jgi:iron complex outermembrane receptor protein
MVLRRSNASYKASATVFYTKYKDRIAKGFDPLGGSGFDISVGGSKARGLELEFGTVPVEGWSTYASATLTRDTLDNNLPVGTIANNVVTLTTQPTSGKQFPDSPKMMAATSVQYAVGPFLANVQAKFTGQRFTTLANDQSIAGFTTIDTNLAYRFNGKYGFKNPTLRLNVSNLFDRTYLLANSGSGSSITINATGAGASQPSLYVGAPRFASVSFQVDY